MAPKDCNDTGEWKIKSEYCNLKSTLLLTLEHRLCPKTHEKNRKSQKSSWKTIKPMGNLQKQHMKEKNLQTAFTVCVALTGEHNSQKISYPGGICFSLMQSMLRFHLEHSRASQPNSLSNSNF